MMYRIQRTFSRSAAFLLPLLTLLLLLAACQGQGTQAPEATAPPPTTVPLFREDVEVEEDGGPQMADDGEAQVNEDVTEAADGLGADFVVAVDAGNVVGEISPLVYGVSGGPVEYLKELRPTLHSWGGNPSTRYNWRLGNAWNTGSDYFYRNTDYNYDPAATGRTADENAAYQAEMIGAEMRLAVPTLGWVAKNSDLETCSFPLPNGECGTANDANCKSPNEIADPTTTSVRSTPEDIQEWLQQLVHEQGYDLRYIAMDNEPELWGYTHYDVHPECTTYQEILDKFLTYATAVREVVPEAQITGPVTCCWEFYWHSAAGSQDEQQHGNQEFLPWFLEQVRQHDEETGRRTLDVLDIHYYPEGVFNNDVDEETAALRLRRTRSLWDRNYVDESWIAERVALIPRMRELIDEYYPGTGFGISEWNWGADETMNGALAIVEVLGILGREEVDFAAYWQFPPADSPGFYAFKMFTNYDSAGGRFVGDALQVQSQDEALVSGFGALDEAGTLRLMLVNKQPETATTVRVQLEDFKPGVEQAEVYRYDQSVPEDIQVTQVEVGEGGLTLELPAYSITLLVVEGN